MRTAVRRGWLNDAPKSDRDALVARFTQAMTERHAADPDHRNARAALAEAWAMLEMDGDNLRNRTRALRYCWAGEWTGHTTGRPRDRWHVSECAHRIDAHAIRRQAKADGTDLCALGAIVARRQLPTGEPDPAAAEQRIALVVAADSRYGWRVWLVCPRCKRRRAHLYPVRAGVRCRQCAGIGYRQGQACAAQPHG